MNEETRLSIRMDKEVKDDATEILENLGLDLSTAIRVFLKQIIIQKGIPFSITNEHMILQTENDKKFEGAAEDYLGGKISLDTLVNQRVNSKKTVEKFTEELEKAIEEIYNKKF